MRVSLIVVLIGAFLGADGRAADIDFERDIAPLLLGRCLLCHDATDPSGGLSLSTREGALRGGESGPALAAADVQGSLLWQRVHASEMPPPERGQAQTLPADEQQLLAQWIAEGASWPKDRRLDRFERTTAVRGGRDWWSLQPIKRPTPPHASDWARNPIDAFIEHQLTQQHLTPAPDANRSVLARRLAIDLIGISADPGGVRDAAGRRLAGLVASPCGPIARLASVWRPLGAVLVGRRQIRRDLRIRTRSREALRLALSRLGRASVEPGLAL